MMRNYGGTQSSSHTKIKIFFNTGQTKNQRQQDFCAYEPGDFTPGWNTPLSFMSANPTHRAGIV